MSLPSLPAPPPLILHRNGEPLAVVASAPVVDLTAAALTPGQLTQPGHDVIDLLTAAETPALTLTRDEEGHLLSAGPGVTVNGRAAQHALLVDGDRLGLGPRLRLVYRRPNPASQTAVLDLTAGRLRRPNLRRIVLLAGECLIGPHRGCHLRDATQNPARVLRPGGDTILIDSAPLHPGAPAQPHGGADWSVALLAPAS